ncbi:hypothetical protein MTR67_031571 [Solanum verrucosum]|uniref:Retrotransposon gag domain-containing protein n=1 Tax=Solanum verrucosum TaxID=315347 RepID=A0AAF0U2U0_SOLVR|nr:hypothetical protein MTR67_031571 [Solanum verrucosum]
MPPRKTVRGHPTRRNVEEQGVPNAPEVQPQREVTNAEFREEIRMLSQGVTNQVGQKEGLDKKRLTLRGSWKKGRAEEAPPASWACFEEAFLGRFIPRELKEAKVWEFLTLKQDSLSVHEYNLKFTQLSPYALKIVADMRSRISLDVVVLSRLLSKKAYELELPQELAAVHLVFHIFMLKKCMGDPSLIIPTEDIGIKDSLSYEEVPIRILDRQVRKLRTKEVASVEILWRNQFVEEATWEGEEDKKRRYPYLFETREVPDQGTNPLFSTL